MLPVSYLRDVYTKDLIVQISWQHRSATFIKLFFGGGLPESKSSEKDFESWAEKYRHRLLAPQEFTRLASKWRNSREDRRGRDSLASIREDEDESTFWIRQPLQARE